MKQLNRFINSSTTATITIVAVLLLSFSLVLYYQRNYLGSEAVFWETIANNLNTSSITRYQEGKQLGSLTINERTTLIFRPELSLTSRITFEGQHAPDTETVVIQDVEALGFNDNDFLRYLAVSSADSGFNDKFNNFITNKWVVVEQTSSEDPEPVVELLSDNLIDNSGHSLILYGSLSREVRHQIMDIIQSGGYLVDFNQTREQVIDGRLIYEYDLVVDISHFGQAIVLYLASYGYQELADSVEATIAQSGPDNTANLTVQIDARARAVVQITNEEGELQRLTAQGVNQTLTRPEPELSTREIDDILSD